MPLPPAQFDSSIVSQLACPACFGDLRYEAANAKTANPEAANLDDEHSEDARLVCAGCGRRYPIVDGIPKLIVARAKQDFAF